MIPDDESPDLNGLFLTFSGVTVGLSGSGGGDTRVTDVRLPSLFDLSERVVVVTGAGSPTGIGVATARLASELGARVVLTSTTERVYERVAELGDGAIGVVGDLTDPATAEHLVAAALDAFGRLDGVVANAGMTSLSDPVMVAGALEEIEPTAWRAGLARNLDTAYHVVRAALPALRTSPAGRVVLVASVTGPLMAMRHEPVYATAKAGLVGLARALALDLAADAVTVNAVAPGWIATGSQTPHEAEQGRRVPLGRSARPEEVAAGIAWLLGSGGGYTTGQCLVIDGGGSIAEER